MQLILVRHAEAVNAGVEGAPTDFDRFLTPLGRQQAARLADALAARGMVVGSVVTSPFVRARQTAESLVRLTGAGPGEPAVSEFLACGGLKRKRLSKAVADLNVDSAILVGHNPDLEEYLGWLVGGPPSTTSLEKAAAAAVRFDGAPEEGAGSLEWLVTPAWFMPGPGA